MNKAIFWGQPAQTNVIRPGEWIVPQKGINPATLPTDQLFNLLYSRYTWLHLMHSQNLTGITTVSTNPWGVGEDINLVPNLGSVGGNFTQDTANEYYTVGNTQGRLDGINAANNRHLSFPVTHTSSPSETMVFLSDYNSVRPNQAFLRLNAAVAMRITNNTTLRFVTAEGTQFDLTVPIIPEGQLISAFVFTQGLGEINVDVYLNETTKPVTSFQYLDTQNFSFNALGNSNIVSGGSAFWEGVYLGGILKPALPVSELRTLFAILAECHTREATAV